MNFLMFWPVYQLFSKRIRLLDLGCRATFLKNRKSKISYIITVFLSKIRRIELGIRHYPKPKTGYFIKKTPVPHFRPLRFAPIPKKVSANKVDKIPESS